MKCAEVMEWMHRYLDQDLSRDEIVEMFRHIDNCPSCAEVFERLRMLSKQLEELPDVKVPFSLVDSIMPQLDELDRAARDQSAAREEERVVVPFSSEGNRGKFFKGTSIASRTGIGAVAAAMLLGIAIFNMPDKIPSANVDQMLQDNAKATVGDDDMDKVPAYASAGDGQEQLNTAESGTFSIGSQESAVAPAAQDEVPSADTAVPDDVAIETPEESPVVSNDPGTKAGGRSVTAPANSAKPSATEKVTPTKQNNSDKSPKGDSDIDSGEKSRLDQRQSDSSKVEKAAADNASTPSLEGSVNMPRDYEKGVLMSLFPATTTSKQTWTSPDKQLVAEFVGQQLVIYKVPVSGIVEDKVALTSYPLEGKWVSGEWSPDSLQFTYIIERDGINVTKIYDVKTEASAAPSQAATPTVTPEGTPAPSPGE